jgi:hypothetical protein
VVDGGQPLLPLTPQGILGHLMAESQRLADAAGELAWRLHHVNGTVVCASRTPPVPTAKRP